MAAQKVSRHPNTQQSSQNASQVQKILKNNRSDPNLKCNELIEKEGSPLDILQKHKRERIERKELGDSTLQESSGGNISALGDTFRQTIFNPAPPSTATAAKETRSSEQHKQIPLPNSSGKKSSHTSNGFDGTSYQNLLNKLIPQ